MTILDKYLSNDYKKINFKNSVLLVGRESLLGVNGKLFVAEN